MKIKLFDQFINENGIGGVNVGGVNFGTDKGNVGSSNFGMKGDASFNQRGDMNPIEVGMVYSEYMDDYYSTSDIKSILMKYNIWCKQNNEEPLEISNFTTTNLDYVLRMLDSK